MGDNNLSLGMHPDTGVPVATDTALNPSSSVTAVAYDRNDLNAATPTTLFGIDTNTDQLVRIGGVDGSPSPNGGAVTALELLGINALGANGFDIGLDGIAYAGLSAGTRTPSNLYTINLSTGAATLAGQIGDGSDGIRSLAVAVPEPSATLLALSAGLAFLRRRKNP